MLAVANATPAIISSLFDASTYDPISIDAAQTDISIGNPYQRFFCDFGRKCRWILGP